MRHENQNQNGYNCFLCSYSTSRLVQLSCASGSTLIDHVLHAFITLTVGGVVEGPICRSHGTLEKMFAKAGEKEGSQEEYENVRR